MVLHASPLLSFAIVKQLNLIDFFVKYYHLLPIICIMSLLCSYFVFWFSVLRQNDSPLSRIKLLLQILLTILQYYRDNKLKTISVIMRLDNYTLFSEILWVVNLRNEKTKVWWLNTGRSKYSSVANLTALIYYMLWLQYLFMFSMLALTPIQNQLRFSGVSFFSMRTTDSHSPMTLKND